MAALKSKVKPDKAEFLPGFFQAHPGGYGEGDKFLGVIIPDIRQIARRHRTIKASLIRQLLASPWHECRMLGTLILVDQFEQISKFEQQSRKLLKRNHKPELSFQSSEEVRDFYLENLAGVNNWDLVDSSSHKILGQWIVHNPVDEKILYRLAKSKVMWEQRVAVISTLPLIKLGNFDAILTLAEKLMGHPHDLMHKAIGWMLREAGKQDVDVLRGFLNNHVREMPRTMLRYAIEKLSEKERRQWLSN